MTTYTDEYVLPAATAIKFTPLLRGATGATASLVGSAVLCLGAAAFDWSSVAVVIGVLAFGVIGLFFGATLLTRESESLTPGERLLAGASVIGGSLSVGTVGLVAFVLGLMLVIAER